MQTSIPTYTVKHLFGTQEDIMLDVCGRQIIEVMAGLAAGPPLPLLLGISIRSSTKATIKGVVNAVTTLLM
jgi:hypothetical protein